MTYINPIFHYGLERFAKACVRAGVDGVIIPDVPLEEEDLIAGFLHQHGIAFIRLVALTSPKERVVEIARRSEGFLYAVSVMGTTGVRQHHDEHVKEYLQTLKEVSPVPVLAGFGVSKGGEQARDLGEYCDGLSLAVKLLIYSMKEK